MTFTFQFISRFHQFRLLLEQWRDVYQKMPAAQRDVTVGPQWAEGLWFRFGPANGLRLLAVYHGEVLVMVLPFRLTQTWRRTTLTLLCELVPAFCPNPSLEVFRFAIQVLKRYRKFLLEGDHLDCDHPVTALFFKAAAETHQVREIRTYPHIYVSLDQGWDCYWQDLSKNTKEGLRKARARLQQNQVEARYFCAKEPGEMAEAVAFGLSIDAMSWKFERGGALGMDHHEDAFFQRVLHAFAGEGRARVFGLALNQQPAAFIFAFLQGSTAYFSIWSYAETTAYFMTGKLLMAYALEQLSQEGIHTVDFWGRPDAFKASWSKTSRIRKKICIAPAPGPAQRLVARVAEWASAWRRTSAAVVLLGDPEAYRLKEDRPGWLRRKGEALGFHWKAGLMRREYWRLEARSLAQDADEIEVKRETAKEAFFLGWRPSDAREKAWVFFQGSTLLGGLVVAPFPNQKHQRKVFLRFLTSDTPTMQRCLQAFFQKNPAIRWLYERKGEEHHQLGESLVNIFPKPGLEASERVAYEAH